MVQNDINNWYMSQNWHAGTYNHSRRKWRIWKANPWEKLVFREKFYLLVHIKHIICWKKTHRPTYPSGPLPLPVTKSGNWTHTLIAHVYVAYMITVKLGHIIGCHFSGCFVSKNSKMTTELREYVWEIWLAGK